MSNSKSRLGRGLGGLISGAGTNQPKSQASTSPAKKTPAKASTSSARGKQAVAAKPAAVAASVPNAPGYREIEVKDIVAQNLNENFRAFDTVMAIDVKTDESTPVYPEVPTGHAVVLKERAKQTT